MYRTRTKKSSKPVSVTPKAVLYARVSSKEQEEGFSIDAQLALLRSYAQSRNLDVVEEFIESETAKSSGRPEFGRMVNLLKGKAANVVIVEKTDRLYRNLKDRVTLDELDIEIHLVKENTILSKDSKSHEKFIHDIKVVVAKNYIDNLSEEVRKGMLEKAKQGFYPSYAPLGYLNAIENGVRTIVPDPERAPIIKQLFEKYASGELSLSTARTYATLLGLRTRKGYPVHKSTIQYMLMNPVYIGEFEWKGARYKGSHIPIISRDTFYKVQAALDSRAATPSATMERKQYLYGGMVKCAVCGCLATPYKVKDKYVYYACTGSKGCNRAGIREETLTDAIAKLLEGLTIDPKILKCLQNTLKEIHSEQRNSDKETQESILKERERLNNVLYKLYDDRLEGKVPESVYDRKIAETQAKLVAINEKLGQLDRASAATWEDSFKILELVSNSAFRFKTANFARKREMAKNALSNFLIDGKNPVLELRPWFKMVASANEMSAEISDQKVVNEIWWAQLDSN